MKHLLLGFFDSQVVGSSLVSSVSRTCKGRASSALLFQGKSGHRLPSTTSLSKPDLRNNRVESDIFAFYNINNQTIKVSFYILYHS